MQANIIILSAYQKAATSIVNTTVGGGYATVGSGADAVDDCGLRFLIAVKQHEYLLRCLPHKQKIQLKSKGFLSFRYRQMCVNRQIFTGLPHSSIIWALHSETETELLNLVPALQSEPSWEKLRCVGGVWWLKNVTLLKSCVEKVIKIICWVYILHLSIVFILRLRPVRLKRIKSHWMQRCSTWPCVRRMYFGVCTGRQSILCLYCLFHKLIHWQSLLCLK